MKSFHEFRSESLAGRWIEMTKRQECPASQDLRGDDRAVRPVRRYGRQSRIFSEHDEIDHQRSESSNPAVLHDAEALFGRSTTDQTICNVRNAIFVKTASDHHVNDQC